MSLLLVLVLLGVCVLFALRGRRRRRPGEPPLVTGWIPFLGEALKFQKDAHRFLEEQKRRLGDVFTVHIAGRYMTFIMNPLLYPNIIKHGRQLDFHEFTNRAASFTFGYPPMTPDRFPGFREQVQRSFQLLQGESLEVLTQSMMGNLMLVFRQDHLDPDRSRAWRSGGMLEFCSAVMLEATLLTLYGRPPAAARHAGMDALRSDFTRFDAMFPLLISQTPLWLLGQTRTVREKLIAHFLPQRISAWNNPSQFIQRRAELFDQYPALRDTDKAAHHFAILWASVGNTVPAAFWALYHLLQHPPALEAVRQEIQQVLTRSGVRFNSQEDLRLSREQLDSMLHLESSISESLRLSSASMNIRVVQEDFSLRLDPHTNMAVRKGDIIALYPQSMHLDPDIYPDPQVFRFDRFVDGDRLKSDFYKDGQRLRYFLMPFGSGSTMCPGRFFAVNEIKQFLCLLLLYFDLQQEEQEEKEEKEEKEKGKEKEQGAMLDCSRAGLGVLQPNRDVQFRYRRRLV